jgi:hypothetical protein
MLSLILSAAVSAIPTEAGGRLGDVCGEGVGAGLPATCISGLTCDIIYPADKLGFCRKATIAAASFAATASGQVLGRLGDVCGEGTGAAGLPVSCIEGLKCEIAYPADKIGFCRKDTVAAASFTLPASASGEATGKKGDVCGAFAGPGFPEIKCAVGLTCNIKYPVDKLGFCE